MAKKLELNKTSINSSIKYSIVLIDQNEMFLNLLNHELTKYKGFSVVHTSNGIDFLSSDNVEPDLIIMDMIMEGINGIEMIKKLRSDQKFDKTKILVLSEKLSDSDINQLKSLNIDNIVQKPVNIGEVLFMVESILTKQS